MILHIKLIGFILIVLGLVHVIFPRYFNWKEELKTLTLINQQLMTIHTFFVALTVVLMGVLCLVSTIDLTTTNLGKTISFGFGIFWLARLLIQFFGYSSTLWKGKKFETFVHIVFSCLWTYFSAIFILNYLS